MKKFNEFSNTVQNIWKVGTVIGVLIVGGWTAQAMYSKKADIVYVDSGDKEVQTLLAGSLQRQQVLGIDSEIRQRQEWIRYIDNLIRERKATAGDHQARQRFIDEIKYLQSEKDRFK